MRILVWGARYVAGGSFGTSNMVFCPSNSRFSMINGVGNTNNIIFNSNDLV